MAASTGIVLTAGVVTIGNEFLQGASLTSLFRPAVATLGTALVFAGLEKLDTEAAVGLATIVMITVLIGGVNPKYKSPAQEVLSLIGKKA
jgi:hypothetical protein